MEPAQIAPLTPEQLAAMAAGGGFARCEDPTTHLQYQLIQIEPSVIDDDYIRQKVQEAYADLAGFEPLDMDAVRAELQRRLAAKKMTGRSLMPQVDRFRQVEEDLLEIAEYIARDNPTAAARWLDQIEEKFWELAQQPLVGEAVDHIQPGLRR